MSGSAADPGRCCTLRDRTRGRWRCRPAGFWDPPYPDGTRPTITNAPTYLQWGQRFDITYNSNTAIALVTLLRCGSATHSFNADQRLIVCSFETTGDGTLLVGVPPTAMVAPPGNYMLWLVDADKRPSERARFVTVGSLWQLHTEVGGEVTALVPRGGHIDLFTTGTDGVVWSVWWEAATGWGDWFPIMPATHATVGATVTTLVPRDGHIDLFVTGTDGTVNTAWWESGPGWQGWFTIHPEGKMQPGATGDSARPS